MRRRISERKPDYQRPARPPMLGKAAESLVAWFVANRRDLPWRRDSVEELENACIREVPVGVPTPRRDPYRTWIAEIMLQQTQVAAVVDHFNRWMLRFPELKVLAKAKESEVLEAWAGLGYYSRARNVLATARTVTDELGGRFPWEREELLRLKGIGEYTAGAIASLAFNLPVPILDGNVTRVFSRVHGLDFLPDSLERKQIYWDLARSWAQSHVPASVNEGLMELGALVCLLRGPKCEICPLTRFCRARIEKRQSSLPPAKPKKKVTLIEGFALVISNGEKILLHRPVKPGFLAGLLTFPIVEASDLPGLRKAWNKKHPDFPLQSVRLKNGTITHSITFRRFRLRITESRIPSSAGGKGLPAEYQWISTGRIDALLVSSLPRKIWKLSAKASA